MAEEFESVELEYSEDDVLYYLVDEDDVEVGFVLMEDGEEVEYYYEGYEADDYERAKDEDVPTKTSESEVEYETIELEVAEDDILYRIVDENDVEIGFVLMEDGEEVEYYYDQPEEEDAPGADGAASTTAAKDPVAADEPPEPQEPENHGYLYKMASIAGHKGNKARKKAEVQLDKVRDRAEVQVDKASAAIEEGGKKLKAKKDETDLGITREDIAETTADLNAIAKEGAETAKELKEAYDDIMDSFGFLMPKKIKRRLP